jgi:soluble lytic murein transglycosylase-like protein
MNAGKTTFGAWIVIGSAAAIVLLTGFGTVFAFAAMGSLTRNNPGYTGGQRTNCANVKVPTDYLPWVKDAASKYLNGDEAMIIALIQIESSWNPQSTMSSSGATGLGQFVYLTAKGIPEFAGGTDKSGRTWPKGNLYNQKPPPADDARFDPERSIYASARFLSAKLQEKAAGMTGTDALYNAYIYGYHGGCNLGGKHCEEAKTGGQRLINTYNQLIQSGQCV